MAKKLDAVHHIALPVADLKRAAQWYQTSFACELILEDRFEVVLQFQNVRLSLVLPSSQQPHIAFERPDAAAFGELRLQRDSSRSTYISDPTGNILELIAPPSTDVP